MVADVLSGPISALSVISIIKGPGLEKVKLKYTLMETRSYLRLLEQEQKTTLALAGDKVNFQTSILVHWFQTRNMISMHSTVTTLKTMSIFTKIAKLQFSKWEILIRPIS